MSWETTMKLQKPKCCAKEGTHRAEVRVWVEKDRLQHDRRLGTAIRCDVTEEGWAGRWRKFRTNEKCPICLCDDAAAQMGLVW